MKRCFSVLAVALLLFVSNSAFAATYFLATAKMLVTTGQNTPLANAKVTIKDTSSNEVSNLYTNSNGVAWAILRTSKSYNITVESGDKFFSINKAIIGTNNYTVDCHVAFQDNDNVTFTATKSGSSVFCKLMLNILPAADYTIQLVQTGCTPNAIWLKDYPTVGGTAEWWGWASTWQLKVYDKSKLLVGTLNFEVTGKDTLKKLTVNCAHGSKTTDGGM
ncbi:MAG: carboxypeptidase regulatory-like domain-containing protein [Candidatus Riflebacteria bacterium]|nr:carboxypeptidase regulatory-like domain-containing protein [Candidatus Riflebacteria bacterium]